jgi:hypothetical protein
VKDHSGHEEGYLMLHTMKKRTPERDSHGTNAEHFPENPPPPRSSLAKRVKGRSLRREQVFPTSEAHFRSSAC